MSTKTLRKRIALVAVSAMGFGLLSSVSAIAAAPFHGTGTPAISDAGANNGTLGVVTGFTETTAPSVAGGTQGVATATIVSSGSMGLTIAATNTATGKVTVSGGTISKISVATTLASDLKSFTLAQGAATITVKPDAGATSIVVKSYADSTDVSNGVQYYKLTISVVASATVGTFSATKSYAKLVTTATGSATTYTDTAGASTRTNGQEGIIDWTVNDANGNDMPTTSIITASATNGALVSFSTGTEIGSSASQSLTTSDGTIYVAQPVTNAAVSTVVTISIDGAVWTTKSLTITGDIASIKLTDATVGQSKTAANGTGAFNAAAYDAAGNLVVAAITSDGSRYNASVSAASATATSATDVQAETFTCSATPGTAKLSYYVTNAALVKIVSNDLTVKCAGDPYTWTAALDKSTYKPGDVATLTITAKDSKGNLTNATAVVGTTAKPITISGGQLTAVTAASNADTFSTAAGVKTYKFTVGTTEGNYSLVVDMPNWQGGTNSSSLSQTAQTVAYSVSSGSASVTNAEVLSAIVKLIASINKQIAALQKALLKK